MLRKSIATIEKTDLEALIADNIPEAKTLEYKAQLNLNTYGEKKDFLAEVSAFANAAGGDLIVGINEKEEKNGDKSINEVPLKTSETGPIDNYKLSLEQLIQSGIDPKLRVDIKPVIWVDNVEDKGYLLVIRVPQSFNAPHMVTYQKSSKFYSRNSSGKYPLDVHEIKNAVLANDAQGEKVRNFIRDRLGKIIADETPAKLSEQARLVLHIIPLNTFLRKEKLQVQPTEDLKNKEFYPLYALVANYGFNVDGFLTYDGNRPPNYESLSYLQLFFEGGMIETVTTTPFRVYENSVTNKKTTNISSPDGDEALFLEVKRYLETLEQFGAGLPAFIFMSILNCKGAEIQRSDAYYPTPYGPTFDRNEVILPEVLIQDWEKPLPEQMKPLFDSLWNAFGYERSPNFGADRNWEGHR